MAFDDSGETAVVLDLLVITMADLLRKTRMYFEEMSNEKVAGLERKRWVLVGFPFIVVFSFIAGVVLSADFIQSHFGIQMPLAIAISLVILVPLTRPSIVESFKIYTTANRRLNALKREQAPDRNPFGV